MPKSKKKYASKNTLALLFIALPGITWLQTEAKAILKAGGAFSENGLQKVRELNQICIRKNMSPGGAADLLAATIFLCRMETLMERRKGILQ